MSFEKPSPKFSDYLFWDINRSKLDYDQNATYIIDRVVMKGCLSDWYSLLEFYGSEKIKEVTTNMKYLDKYSLSFLSTYFDIPKENFKCYKHRQLIQELWPY
jgi:hypothetical protein